MNIVSQSEEAIQKNIFLFKVPIVKNKDIRTTSTSTVSLVDFEQVNVSWDVIKSLLNDFWSILKMLCSKCCSRRSCFYWHNALIYSLLNKNAGDTFKYYILENLISSEIKLCRQYDRGTSETKTGKSKATYICFFRLKFVKMKKIFSIVALKQPNSEGRIFVLYKYLRRLLTRTVSPKFLSDNLSL